MSARADGPGAAIAPRQPEPVPPGVASPAHSWLIPTSHALPDDPWRHVGRGSPLQGTSWLNRPAHAGWFLGGIFHDDLIRGSARQSDDLLGGFRFGRDFDHFWGAEFRIAASYPEVEQAGQDLGSSRNLLADLHVVHYPWGDSRVRPYGSLGLGVAGFHFTDVNGRAQNHTTFTIPIGVGVKFQSWRWLAWRLELMNNVAFSNHRLSTMNNVSLTAGVEMRYGGRRTSYAPW